MPISFSTRSNETPGLAPILILTGSAAGQVRITLTGGVPKVILNGDVLDVPPGLVVSGYDATGLSGVTVDGVDDGAASYLTGAAAADSLHGGGGEDTLWGGAGNDLLDGGAADDLVIFTSADTATGLTITIDANTIRTSAGEVDWLLSIDRIDLSATAYDDVITGSNRPETLSGGAGDDVIRGNGGADLIAGGAGRNILWGGAGRDIFEVGGAGSTNLVMDFTIDDRLSLLRADGAAALTITSYAAGGADGLGLGAVRYQDMGNGLVRLHVGADDVAGADYSIDIAGLGTGALLRRPGFSAGTAHLLEMGGYSFNRGTANADYFWAMTVMRGGGAGNDLFSGGAGVQAVVMGSRFADIAILNQGNGTFKVIDNRPVGEGADTLYDVELLILSDRVVQLANPQLLLYVGSGKVDESWYLSMNPDVTAAVAAGRISSGTMHYFFYGQAEGRQPNATSDNQGKAFSESAYLALNPDIREAVAAGWFDSGYDHYLAYGRTEGRMAYPSQALLRVGFDEAAYLLANPDVALSVSRAEYVNGYEHFARFGAAEGRDPNVFFDAAWYLARNPDVAAGIAQGRVASAVDHYMLYGWREGRDPSAYFDTSAYLERNLDVGAAGMNPLIHYLGWGQAEGRIATVADLSLLG